MKIYLIFLPLFFLYSKVQNPYDVFKCENCWKLSKMDVFLQKNENFSVLESLIPFKSMSSKELEKGSISCPIVDEKIFDGNTFQVYIWRLSGHHNTIYFYYESKFSFSIIQDWKHTGLIIDSIQKLAEIDRIRIDSSSMLTIEEKVDNFVRRNNTYPINFKE